MTRVAHYYCLLIGGLGNTNRARDAMFRVFNCLTVEHDWRLVLLAVLICFLTSLAAINLFHRARAASSSTRLAWLATTGITTGCGIWATHFIAMLAYEPGIPVAYNVGLTGLSLMAAAAVTSIGFAVSLAIPGLGAALVGGVVVGAGVGAMHYTGMWALEVPGRVAWDLPLVMSSVGLGMVFGAAALASAVRSDEIRTTLLAALLLTLAIVSHHFTAMGAVEILPDPTRVIDAFSLSPTALALAIANAAVAVPGHEPRRRVCRPALASERRAAHDRVEQHGPGPVDVRSTEAADPLQLALRRHVRAIAPCRETRVHDRGPSSSS